LIHRWHLVKKDKTAQLGASRANRLVDRKYYPVELRTSAMPRWRGMKPRGRGLQERPRREVQPDNADWDGDIRYNAVDFSPNPPWRLRARFRNPRRTNHRRDIMLNTFCCQPIAYRKIFTTRV
jgi:hypothetical protein